MMFSDDGDGDNVADDDAGEKATLNAARRRGLCRSAENEHILGSCQWDGRCRGRCEGERRAKLCFRLSGFGN